MKKMIVFLVLAIGILYAEKSHAGESIEDLLQAYTREQDLSHITRVENGGSVILYTREDLEQMQVFNLRDLMKSLRFLTYTESRFGIPDPFYEGTIPFRSSRIRIYIDDHEIASAFYGSGFAFLGNIDLGFVDHVEFYQGLPSFLFSAEASYLTIRLYSKKPERERGAALLLQAGSHGTHSERLEYAHDGKNVSLYAMLSHSDDNFDEEGPSRDHRWQHLFTTATYQNLGFQLQAAKKNQDTFLNFSPDLNNKESSSDYSYLHAAASLDLPSDAKINFSYDYFLTDSDFEHYEPILCFDYDVDPNCVTRFSPKMEENTLTLEAKQQKDYGNHHLLAGLLGRHKEFDFKRLLIGDNTVSPPPYDTQQILTAYLQDEYTLSDRQILTLGVKHSWIDNNGGIEDESAWFLRLSHIYTLPEWVFKTFAGKMSILPEPYVYTNFTAGEELEISDWQMIGHETTWHRDDIEIRTLISRVWEENMLYSRDMYTVTNYDETLGLIFGSLRFQYDIGLNHRLSTEIFRIKYNNHPLLERFTMDGGLFRWLGKYENLEWFSELGYRNIEYHDIEGWDLSAGISYSPTRDLKISLKGEDIFDQVHESSYFIVDPSTGLPTDSFESGIITQRFLVSMEYRF